MAGGTPANPAALASWLFRFRLFDEHYGDAVHYRVEDFALRATQVVRFLELHFCVAFRAGEDFEQFLRDHWRMVVRLAP
jgi:hypothetical protein